MCDGNLDALNKHLKKIDDAETDYEMFCEFIDDDLVELSELIDATMKKARDYNGVDFTDELKELIKDLI